MLATLPYNSFKSYCVSENIHLINLVYRHADCLKITLSNAANRQYVLKQPKLIKLLLYTLLLNTLVFSAVLSLDQGLPNTSEREFLYYDFLKPYNIYYKKCMLALYMLGRYPAIVEFTIVLKF